MEHDEHDEPVVQQHPVQPGQAFAAAAHEYAGIITLAAVLEDVSQQRDPQQQPGSVHPPQHHTLTLQLKS